MWEITNLPVTEVLNLLVLSAVIASLTGEVLFNLKLKVRNYFLQFLITKLYCFKCISFWLTLAVTHNVYTASLTALIALTLDKIIRR